jgi:hypothetical protein
MIGVVKLERLALSSPLLLPAGGEADGAEGAGTVGVGG